MHVVLSEFIVHYNAASLESAVATKRKFSLVWMYLQGNADCVTVVLFLAHFLEHAAGSL